MYYVVLYTALNGVEEIYNIRHTFDYARDRAYDLYDTIKRSGGSPRSIMVLTGDIQIGTRITDEGVRKMTQCGSI